MKAIGCTIREPRYGGRVRVLHGGVRCAPVLELLALPAFAASPRLPALRPPPAAHRSAQARDRGDPRGLRQRLPLHQEIAPQVGTAATSRAKFLLTDRSSERAYRVHVRPVSLKWRMLITPWRAQELFGVRPKEGETWIVTVLARRCKEKLAKSRTAQTNSSSRKSGLDKTGNVC